MKTISIPKLKNPQDFESFCIDFFNCKYKVDDFKKWGKEGQSQKGIDLFSFNKKILVECKSRVTDNLRDSDLIEIINKTKQHPLYESSKRIIIATSRGKKTSLQEIASKLNVEIFFWEDFEDDLCKPKFQKVLVDNWDFFPISNVVSLVNLKSTSRKLFLGQDKISGKSYYENKNLFVKLSNLELNYLFLKKILDSTSEVNKFCFLDKFKKVDLKINSKYRSDKYPIQLDVMKIIDKVELESRGYEYTRKQEQTINRSLNNALKFLSKCKNGFCIVETSNHSLLNSLIVVIKERKDLIKKMNIQIVLIWTGEKSSFNSFNEYVSDDIRKLNSKEFDIESFRIKII